MQILLSNRTKTTLKADNLSTIATKSTTTTIQQILAEEEASFRPFNFRIILFSSLVSLFILALCVIVYLVFSNNNNNKRTRNDHHRRSKPKANETMRRPSAASLNPISIATTTQASLRHLADSPIANQSFKLRMVDDDNDDGVDDDDDDESLYIEASQIMDQRGENLHNDYDDDDEEEEDEEGDRKSEYSITNYERMRFVDEWLNKNFIQPSQQSSFEQSFIFFNPNKFNMLNNLIYINNMNNSNYKTTKPKQKRQVSLMPRKII